MTVISLALECASAPVHSMLCGCGGSHNMLVERCRAHLQSPGLPLVLPKSHPMHSVHAAARQQQAAVRCGGGGAACSRNSSVLPQPKPGPLSGELRRILRHPACLDALQGCPAAFGGACQLRAAARVRACSVSRTAATVAAAQPAWAAAAGVRMAATGSGARPPCHVSIRSRQGDEPHVPSDGKTFALRKHWV